MDCNNDTPVSLDPDFVPPKPEELTCYQCPERGTCPFVDDLYNTDGDCLADK